RDDHHSGPAERLAASRRARVTPVPLRRGTAADAPPGKHRPAAQARADAARAESRPLLRGGRAWPSPVAVDAPAGAVGLAGALRAPSETASAREDRTRGRCAGTPLRRRSPAPPRSPCESAVSQSRPGLWVHSRRLGLG